MKLVSMALSLLALTTTVRADEEKIDVKDVPKAVMSAVKVKFPDAKFIGAEKEVDDGKTSYEIAIEEQGQKADVSISEAGKILEVEKSIDTKTLPKPVADALSTKYPKAKVKKAEQVIKYEGDEEETFFEVLMIEEGKKNVEVKLSKSGKIIETEEADEEDEDEDDKPAAKK